MRGAFASPIEFVRTPTMEERKKMALAAFPLESSLVVQLRNGERHMIAYTDECHEKCQQKIE